MLGDYRIRLMLLIIALVLTVSMSVDWLINGIDAIKRVPAIMTGLGLAALLTILLLNPIADLVRRRQWREARIIIYNVVRNHVCDIADKAYLYMQIGNKKDRKLINFGRGMPMFETAMGLSHLITDMKNVRRRSYGEDEFPRKSMQYYESIKWNIEQMQMVVIPRVLQFSVDEEVVESLIGFDDACRRLMKSAVGQGESADYKMYVNMINMVEAAAEVYNITYGKWLM